MIIGPPKVTTKPRPVALFVPGFQSLKVVTEHGIESARGAKRSYDLLTRYDDHVAYVSGSLRTMLTTVGSSHFTADVWRGHATSLSLDGTPMKILSLRRTLSHLEPDVAYDELTRVVEFLTDQGVRAGSVSSMAWQLWRSTLDFTFEAAFDSRVSRQAFYGGRQEATPSRGFSPYEDYLNVDLSSAYPHSMAERPYAGELRRVSPTTTLDPTVPGLAQVRAHVPEGLPFNPLPYRLAEDLIQWPSGDVEGVWTWGELCAARDLGCTVSVERCWAPVRLVQPFARWWRLMIDARRELGSGPERLVKALTNTLWGCFAMTGDDRCQVRWSDDYANDPVVVSSTPRAMAQAATVHIAAETTSRVRVRLLREGLYAGAGTPVHVDTDGIIIRTDDLGSRPLGDAPGEWRVKRTMPLIEVKAPQCYRFTESGSPQWHYVVSGVEPSRAPSVFMDHPGFNVSFNGFDGVAPPGPILEGESLMRYRLVKSSLETQIYGRPLA